MRDCSFSFHHLGLAVRQRARAASFLRALGYVVGSPVRDDLQNVDLAMATHPAMPAVEIISATERPGPLTRLLEGNAELVYHVCYETPDRRAAIEALGLAGNRLVEILPPTPAVLFGGRSVSFHRAHGFGLIELLDAEGGGRAS